MKTQEWAYSFREEYGWDGPYPTRERAVAEAEATDPAAGWCYVGVMKSPVREIDPDLVLENVYTGVVSDRDYGDSVDDYLFGIPWEVKDELGKALQAVWDAWEAKHGLEPRFWHVDDVETHRWREE